MIAHSTNAGARTFSLRELMMTADKVMATIRFAAAPFVVVEDDSRQGYSKIRFEAAPSVCRDGRQ